MGTLEELKAKADKMVEQADILASLKEELDSILDEQNTVLEKIRVQKNDIKDSHNKEIFDTFVSTLEKEGFNFSEKGEYSFSADYRAIVNITFDKVNSNKGHQEYHFTIENNGELEKEVFYSIDFKNSYLDGTKMFSPMGRSEIEQMKERIAKEKEYTENYKNVLSKITVENVIIKARIKTKHTRNDFQSKEFTDIIDFLNIAF